MDITENFLAYLRHQKRYSAHTLTSYQNDLNDFQVFLQLDFPDLPLKEVSHHIIRSWVLNMMERQMARTTIKRKISSLRSFYKYLLRQNEVQLNPAAQVQVPKAPKKLARVVAEDDMMHLLDKVEFEEGNWGQTQKLIIELFYNTGIRLSELINLKVDDVDLVNQKITVTGKRDKERSIPLSGTFCHKLADYLKEQRQDDTHKFEDYFFLTKKGKKLYPKLVYQIINSYLRRVSGVDQKSPHVLRHSFATHMLNRGADLNSIKELLGHSSLAATQVYTHNSIDKLKTMYNHAHPRGNKS